MPDDYDKILAHLDRLTSEFQRIDDKAPWVQVRAHLYAAAGNFDQFDFDRPGESSNLEACLIGRELLALSEQAGAVADELFQSGIWRPQWFWPESSQWYFENAWEFLLGCLIYFFETSGFCLYDGPHWPEWACGHAFR